MFALLETLGIEPDTHVVMYVLKHPFFLSQHLKVALDMIPMEYSQPPVLCICSELLGTRIQVFLMAACLDGKLQTLQ